MPRRSRLHVPGGLYYVVQRSIARQHLFLEDDDYRRFEELLESVLDSCRARAYAFCWKPDSIKLAVEISDVPIGRLMQRVTGRYARLMHRLHGEPGPLFRPRYHSILIDPDTYLLALIRHIHWTPVRAGLCADPAGYALSSHRSYLAQTSVPWLATHAALRLLGHRREAARQAYQELMREPPRAEDTQRFEHGSPHDPRVLGNAEFMYTLPRNLVVHRSRTSLDEIIEAVARVQVVEREDLLSRSRKRRLSLARALIAWHATQRGIATLTEVGRRLNRDPSTLSIGIERYTRSRPELFQVTALKGVGPLLRRVI
ncbi:MAG TPA: helix-turn-helix domain-containing protein [Steroidobacteraceae bacterium]|nr:helix-turn-helix domain-containing protein [Steroidobacteraceae bacterium]